MDTVAPGDKPVRCRISSGSDGRFRFTNPGLGNGFPRLLNRPLERQTTHEWKHCGVLAAVARVLRRDRLGSDVDMGPKRVRRTGVKPLRRCGGGEFVIPAKARNTPVAASCGRTQWEAITRSGDFAPECIISRAHGHLTYSSCGEKRTVVWLRRGNQTTARERKTRVTDAAQAITRNRRLLTHPSRPLR